MSNELKVGVVVLIALGVAGYFIMQIDDTLLFGTPEAAYSVRVRFDTISGLARDAPVHLAGVRVGRVADIQLIDGQAEVLIRIERSDVELHTDANAQVASQGLLGEKYLELGAGTQAAPIVTDGGFIQAGAAVSIDQMVSVMNGIAADVQETTQALSNVFGSEAGETRMQQILTNLEQLTRDAGVIAQENQGAINSTLSNVEDLTAALSESLPLMIEEFRTLGAEATAMVSDNEAGVSATLEEVRELIGSLERSAGSLEEIMEKINSGDGTAAQLINTSDTIEKANAALDTIDDSLAAFDSFFNRASQTQFSFALRSEWYANDEATKNYFGFRVSLGANNDRGFIFELVNDNIGLPSVSTTITETLNTAGEVIGLDIARVTARDDAFKFSAMLAARLDDWQLRGGLIESEAGVGIDYFLASDRLRFSLESWDFGRNPDPHLKFSGSLDVWDRVFLIAGGDDLLSGSFRQLFFGGGFRFR